MHRFFEGLKPTLHIAHRGGLALGPENTLPAFRRAVEEFRTDMLELDVHVTRDGEVVVSHDATLERCTDGAGAIAERTAEELATLDAAYHFSLDGGSTFPFRGKGVRLPLLRDVLRELPGVRMNIELKDGREGAERPFVEVLQREGAVGRVCIGSEFDATGARLHTALPDACHFYPRDALATYVLTLKSGDTPPKDDRFSVLDMPLYFHGARLIDPPLLEGAHRDGKWINVWTVNDPAEMKRLITEGVGGIMTDRPDLLRSALDRYGRG